MPHTLIHQTDLFHPHGDPDDHWDLACVFALAKAGAVKLGGVLIDYPPEHRAGDPATLAVAQLAHCHGMPGIPVVIGSRQTLAHRRDGLEACAPSDRAAGDWLIRALQKARAPVAVTIVGSCIDVASAAVRAPGLFREKCRALYLNSGSAFPGVEGKLEYNVVLNRAAYAATFDIPCPVYWCPCWHATETRATGRHGTWYRFTQGDVLQSLSPQMQNYFLYALSRSTDPQWLRYLELPVDPELYAQHAAKERNMWSTASFFHAAGLTVTMDGNVVPLDDATDPLYTFEPVAITCDDNGATAWQPAAEPGSPERRIFTLHAPERYTEAMTTALWRLLSEPFTLA